MATVVRSSVSAAFFVILALNTLAYASRSPLKAPWTGFQPATIDKGILKFGNTGLKEATVPVNDGAQDGLLKVIANKLVEVLDTVEFAETFANVLNQQCVTDLIYILGELKSWAGDGDLPDAVILQMFDSWGKLLPSGILSGHVNDPGDFQECLNAEGYLNASYVKGSYGLVVAIPTPDGSVEKQPRKIRGVASPVELVQYMTPEYMDPMLPMIGTCFPNSCGREDLQQLLNNVARAVFGNNFTVTLNPLTDSEKTSLTTGDGIMIILMIAISTVTILASVADVVLRAIGKHDKAKRFVNVVRIFSLPANVNILLNSDMKEPRLSCLYGIHFLSVCWAILGQSAYLWRYQFTWNAIDLYESAASNWLMMPILNSTLAGDTIFVVSAAAISYKILEELDTRKRVNILRIYMKRYFGVTVPLAFVMGIVATVFRHLRPGPLWPYVNNESSKCSEHGWHNILYINTILGSDYNEMCHAHASWYLSNEMIYFSLTPAFVYLLWRWRSVGFGLLSVWIAQAVLHTGLILASNDLAPTYMPLMRELVNIPYWTSVYKRPWTRSAPYAIGIILGYLLHVCKPHRYDASKCSKWISLFGWYISTALAIAVLYSPSKFFDPGNFSEVLASVPAILYGCLHRFVWAVAVAWVIFACVTGHGKWVKGFLSWKPFVPLGRLSFCAFLCSYYVQMIHYVAQYHPVHYDIYSLMNSFVFQLVVSYALGLLLYATLQSPVLQLAKLLVGHTDEDNNRMKDKPGTIFMNTQTRPVF